MEKIYLNDEAIQALSNEALRTMSERLCAVVSRYFESHPEEWVRFLESREDSRKKEEG